MKTRMLNGTSKKGAGFLIVFAIFALMAMLGLSLYRYKVFQRTLQLETSFRDSIQASYAAEYAFRHSLEFLEEGFREARTANTFNGIPVIPINPSQCRIHQGATPGCFQVSKSIDIPAALREENPALPEHAAFFVKCEGNCGLTPSVSGPSRVTTRIAAFKDGSVETWEYVALVGRGSVFSPGVFHGGSGSLGSYVKPVYYNGVKRITKAAIYNIKTQCSAGEAAYNTYVKQYFTTNVCSESSLSGLKDARLLQKQVQVVDESSLQSKTKVESRVLASTLNYKQNLEELSLQYYDDLGYASIQEAESSLKSMNDETFIATVYEPKLSSTLSSSSLQLKSKTASEEDSKLESGSSSTFSGGSGSLSGSSGSSISGSDSEALGSNSEDEGAIEADYELQEDAVASENEVFLDLNRDLSSVSKRNVQLKQVSYDIPEELSYSKVCGADSKYPEYSNIEDEVDVWIDEVKTLEEDRITKVDCGTSCDVEIDCVSGSHVVKVKRGDGTSQSIPILSKDSVVFSSQPLAIKKAYYCNSDKAAPVSLVSEENIVIETAVIAKDLIGSTDPEWSKEKLHKLRGEKPTKVAFISKKDVVVDPSKIKSLELKEGNVLELSENSVASIDEQAEEDKWGGWIEADIAAKGQFRVTGTLLSSKPVTISGAIAAKSIESHIIAADSTNTCKKVGAHVVIDPHPSKVGQGPTGPALGGSVDIEIIKIRRGNADRDFAQGP